MYLIFCYLNISNHCRYENTVGNFQAGFCMKADAIELSGKAKPRSFFSPSPSSLTQTLAFNSTAISVLRKWVWGLGHTERGVLGKSRKRSRPTCLSPHTTTTKQTSEDCLNLSCKILYFPQSRRGNTSQLIIKVGGANSEGQSSA